IPVGVAIDRRARILFPDAEQAPLTQPHQDTRVAADIGDAIDRGGEDIRGAFGWRLEIQARLLGANRDKRLLTNLDRLRYLPAQHQPVGGGDGRAGRFDRADTALDEVRLADKIGDEATVGPLVDLSR